MQRYRKLDQPLEKAPLLPPRRQPVRLPGLVRLEVATSGERLDTSKKVAQTDLFPLRATFRPRSDEAGLPVSRRPGHRS